MTTRPISKQLKQETYEVNNDLWGKTSPLTADAYLELTQEHIHLDFSHPHRVMSSAVLNGGLVQANHIVNLRVPKQIEVHEAPHISLQRYCTAHHWQGKTVGIMTAASMKSFRIKKQTIQGVTIILMVTVGLENARCVGDRAEYREIASEPKEPGTINIILVTSASLTDAAMIEAIQMITEAKTTVLHEHAIKSPISGKLASGTGTDAVVIASGKGPQTIEYCGKHVLFGEVLGTMVVEAISESMQWDIASA